MPWFIPALTAAATFTIARKLVARYWHGVHAHHAQADPAGLRTVASFVADNPDDVLLAIAAELARDLDGRIEVTRDAVRARPAPDASRVDIVRLAFRGGSTYTVELTRAWTGVYLGERTRRHLERVDSALRHYALDVAWFARQDRDLVEPHDTPFDEQAIVAT